MSFIGGYFGAGSPVDAQAVERKVRDFPIVEGDPLDAYDVHFLAGPSSGVFARARRDVQSFTEVLRDGQGNALATLGYLNPPDGLLDGQPFDTSLLRDLPARIEQAEGEFTCLVWNQQEGSIHLINDRFASRPCYVYRENGWVWFATNLQFLLYMAGRAFDLDPLGVLQIFTLQHTVETRTNIAGVERVRPASHWVFDRDGVQQRQYWRLRYDPQYDLDPERYADEVYGAFRAGMEARLDIMQRPLLTLSGGMDSRFMAGAVRRERGIPAFTTTDGVGEVETAEVQFARRVAQAFGLEHRVAQVPAGEPGRALPDTISLIGGLYPSHHTIRTYQNSRQGFDSVLMGGPGDEIAGDLVRRLEDTDPRRTQEAVDFFAQSRQKVKRSHLEMLFRPAVLDEWHAQVNESYCRSFEDVPGPSGGHRISAWMMSKFWPTFTFANLYHTLPTCTQLRPHLTYGFIDRMLRLPVSWLYDRAFYKYILWREFPQLREVPNSNTGELLTGRLLPARLTPAFFARDYLTRKSRGAWQKGLRLSGVKRLLPQPRPFVAQTEMAEAHDNAAMRNDALLVDRTRELLHSYAPLQEMFDPALCDRYIEDFREGNWRTGWVRNDNVLFASLASTVFFYHKMRQLQSGAGV